MYIYIYVEASASVASTYFILPPYMIFSRRFPKSKTGTVFTARLTGYLMSSDGSLVFPIKTWYGIFMNYPTLYHPFSDTPIYHMKPVEMVGSSPIVPGFWLHCGKPRHWTTPNCSLSERNWRFPEMGAPQELDDLWWEILSNRMI